MPGERTRQQSSSREARTASSEQSGEARNALKTPVARRAFLAGTSVAAAGAAYAALASDGEEEAAKPKARSDPRRLGYRETDHIRQFYARARF